MAKVIGHKQIVKKALQGNLYPTPCKKLTVEQKKIVIENFKHHRSIVQSWLFKTKDISDDDAMQSLHWLSMFCWYSTSV